MRIPTIFILLAATCALSGCAAALEMAALDEVGIGVAGAEATAGEAAFASAEVSVSGDLVEEIGAGLRSGTRRGALSNAFSDLTQSGSRIGRLSINRGEISANGQTMATLDSSGRVMAQGRMIGFIDAPSMRLHEVLADGTSRRIGILEGFVRSEGVEIVAQSDGSLVRVLRPNVAVDVIGYREGQYLIRLASGEVFAIPSDALATIALLGLQQLAPGCPDDNREGAVVRNSGEMVRFKHCHRAHGAFILAGDTGQAIIDAYDVKGVLSGDAIPGVQGEQSRRRLVAHAQATAAAVGAQPGHPAMEVLARTAAVPAIEQMRYGTPLAPMGRAPAAYSVPFAPGGVTGVRPQSVFGRATRTPVESRPTQGFFGGRPTSSSRNVGAYRPQAGIRHPYYQGAARRPPAAAYRGRYFGRRYGSPYPGTAYRPGNGYRMSGPAYRPRGGYQQGMSPRERWGGARQGRRGPH